MAEVEAPRRRGPAPGASREDVLEVARAHFLACRRLDVQAIAQECGVGRATVYRWFESREGLLGEAMLSVFEQRVLDARSAVGGGGIDALLDTFDLIFQGLAAAPHIRFLIESEHRIAFSLMTSSEGPVHPRAVELLKGMLDREAQRGAYQPPVDTETLAYVLVRLAESMLFNYPSDEIARDAERMREVVAALLEA